MKITEENNYIIYMCVLISSILFTYIIFIHFIGDRYYILVAKLVTSTLQFFMVPSDVENNVIAVMIGTEWTAIRLSWECSGIISFSVFTGVVLGFPRIPHRWRVGGLFFGYIAIFIGNLLRIFLILFLNHKFPDLSYILFHDFFGRPLSFLWMSTVWFVWFYLTLFRGTIKQKLE